MRAELDRYRLTPTCTSHGSGEYPVIRCDLRAADGAVVARSSGKGAGDQAIASALFEAWEHYWHGHGIGTIEVERDRVLVVTAAEIAAQSALAGEAVVQRMSEDYPAARVGCLRFDSPSGRESIWYPAFLRCPWYPARVLPGDDLSYLPYLRYATNSGTAAGLFEDEAILHAVLEVIERDALSHSLLDWYMANGRPRRIEPPPELDELARVAEQTVGSRPLLLDLTTDLGVPAYCALPSRPTYLGVRGAGASLSGHHAVRRALSELIQLQINTADLGLDLTLRRKLGRVQAFPRLVRCTEMDPIELAARADPGPPVDRTGIDQDVAAMLASVVDRLDRADLTVYTFRWSETDSLPVVSVLVPGLECFWLAAEGIPVLPTGRAARRYGRSVR